MTPDKSLIANMELAYKAIDEYFHPVAETDKTLHKEYKGYIASFGTTLRQLGLLPALLNYFEVNECVKPVTNKASSHHLVDALALMFGYTDAKTFVSEVYKAAIKADKTEIKRLEKQSINYAIALKKTLRLFKIKA